MNQQQLRAYVNLIQQLLACPSGEEWILLRQNEALVTPDLVQVMEQVATQLAHQGNDKEAKFLHNLAGQIHHLFVAQTVGPAQADDREAAYLDLIKALIDCPAGAESKLLAAHQDLIGPGLVRRMQEVAAQLALNGDRETADYLQQWAMELNRLWMEAHDFQPQPQPDRQSHRPSPAEPVEVPPAGEMPSSAPARGPGSTAPAEDLGEDFWAEPSKTSDPAQHRAESAPPTAGSASQPTPGAASNSSLGLDDSIRQHLETIARALTQISESLAARSQPTTDPLWYMEVLERAASGGWVITSEEVQHLIGIKPSCPKGHDSFQRGCWVFEKAGKLGSQTAWRVTKNPS